MTTSGEYTTQPPFEVPINFKKARYWAQRRIPDGYSDGDRRHWPGTPDYRPATDAFYLCFVGQKWAEKDGIVERPDVQYYLDRLPDGYAVFETDQKGGGQYYRRLFGHPKGRFYDSAIKFLPHFLWLVGGMDGECECVLCGKKVTTATAQSQKPRAPREVVDNGQVVRQGKPGQHHVLADRHNGTSFSSRASSTGGEDLPPRRVQRQVRQAGGAPLVVDEEGTEDIYKDCIKKLEIAKGGTKGLEIDLDEEGSIDWKADRKSLPQYLTQIERQHCFVPRIGELVLWCPTFLDDHYLMLETETSQYKFYSFEQRCFHGFPAWRGGIVTAVPSAGVKNGSVDFPDILDTPTKKTAFNTAGFRIETMPDPNDDVDKGLSKQYRYVPLRNIRPLAHWQVLLRGIPPKKLHPSIEYALTCMTSISLLEKWRLKGDWPNGSVLCKGIYLGSELITVGDTVRLLPSVPGKEPHPDILVVDSIRYNLLNMQPEHVRPDVPYLCGTSYISLVGSAYTRDLEKLNEYIASNDGIMLEDPPREPLKNSGVKTKIRPVGAEEYGVWYPWHSERQKYEVSHEQVLGRLYEAEAVKLWTGQRQMMGPQEPSSRRPDVTFDADSVIAGRQYASAADARLPEPQSKGEINWHLADTRVEGLAVATINGIDVGKYHDIRTPPTLKQWRMQAKVADGQQVAPEIIDEYIKDLTQLQLYTGARRGRPAGSKVIDGKLILPGQAASNDDGGQVEETTVLRRPKPSSQMAGAAFATDHDDSSEVQSVDGDEIVVNEGDDTENEDDEDEEDLLAGFLTCPAMHGKEIAENKSKQTVNTASHTKAAAARGQRGSSINDDGSDSEDDEEGDEEEYKTLRPATQRTGSRVVRIADLSRSSSSSSDYDDWLHKHPPVIRGGTEESEGGDYRE